jgi:hypothetical protein
MIILLMCALILFHPAHLPHTIPRLTSAYIVALVGVTVASVLSISCLVPRGVDGWDGTGVSRTTLSPISVAASELANDSAAVANDVIELVLEIAVLPPS